MNVSLRDGRALRPCNNLRYLKALALVFAAALSGCMEAAPSAEGAGSQQAFSSALASATASITPVRQGAYGNMSPEASRSAGQIFAGEPPDITARRDTSTASVQLADASNSLMPSGSAGFQLNFANADVSSVAKAILGDVLKTNYSVDPRVSGQINLTSSRPVPKTSLIPLLERSLASIGASLVKDPELYRIVPASDPGGLANVDYQSAAEGFGTTVIPAKYVPAVTIARMLEAFGSRAGSVRADPATNLVTVQGSALERRSALEAADLIDVDWLRSKSVAILPVSNSTPETVISELNHILDTGEGGLSQNVVQLQPISRLNAVLAVSRRKDAVDLVTKWVGRLDRADYASTGVKVYRLQYAQAKTVAAMLNDMFSGRSGSSGLGGDADQNGFGAGLGGNLGGANPSSMQPNGGMGNAPAGGSNVGAPFGTLKASFTDAPKADKAALGQVQSDPLGSGSGAGNKRVRVTADPSSNTVFVNASRADYRIVEQAIRQMDRAPLQVNIEATIAEVTLNRDLQYGVQVYLHSGKVAASLANSLPILQNYPAFNLLAGAASNPRVLLSALNSITNVKILSSPSLVVTDRQAAVLQVGDQVPVLTRSASSVENPLAPVVNSVDYKDTGIILNVLPRVNANGVVSLDIEQQISSVANQDQSLTPTLSQRRVRSSVAVQNGQTVMLAGLISEKSTTTKDGIPGLSSIKLIGDILGSHDTTGQRTELLIFIRPRIISNGADAEQVTEEFRSRMLSLHRPTVPAISVRD